jgi:signal transduction histidine kinase/tetratricopeptide (TPR) repeat protein
MTRTIVLLAMLAMLGIVGGGQSVPAAAAPDPYLVQWRRDANETRLLAENDAPRAYEQARRLHEFLPVDATGADRARALNVLSRTEIYMAMPAEAAAHARQAGEIATQHGDRVGQVEADLNLALNAVNMADLNELIAAPTRALARLEGVDRPDLLAEALLRATAMYRRVGKLEDSVTVAMHSMEVARASHDPMALLYAHQALGISFDQSFRHGDAREHYEQMLAQARATHLMLQEGYALGGLGSVVSALGDPVGAEQFIQEAIKRYRAVRAPFAVTFGLSNLAYNLRSQHRYADALKMNNEVVAGYERYPNLIGLWFALNFRSENQQSLGNHAAALADVERGYDVAKRIGFPPYIAESARRVALITAAGGDFKRAYELAAESIDVTSKAARTSASTRMVELAKRYEEESQKQEIAELTRRNKEQTAELRQRLLQSRWQWTIVASTVTVLAVTIWFLLRLRRSHRQLEEVNDQRQQAEAEVRALNTTLEQQVRDRTAQLEAANRELESFSYSVSHDLRAPLRGLNGFSRALLEDYEGVLDPSGRDYLHRIQSASQQMSRLIDGMLNLAQVSRGGLSRVPVDLSALAKTVTDDLRNSDPERRADVIIAPNLRAQGDPRLIQLLLQNLLHNAWKFTSTRPTAHIECGRILHNGSPAYFVRDDGVGFDMTYAHKLFGAFQRLHSTAEFPGTGIGLATVQRIVHRHGGHVWAESQLERGTTFYFTLPDESTAATAAGRSPLPPTNHNPTLDSVEDRRQTRHGSAVGS